MNTSLSKIAHMCFLIVLYLGGSTAAVSQSEEPSFQKPAPNSKLTSNSVTFEWSNNDSNVNEWWLYVGNQVGASNYHNSRSLPVSTLSATVDGLPNDGTAVHVRLWYRVADDRIWYFIDETYTASDLTPIIVSPSSGSTLAGAVENIIWQGNDAGVTDYWLYAGSAAGLNDYFNSSNLGTATQGTLTGLPIDGTSTVYVRLWYRAGSSNPWQFVDETFIAGTASAGIPKITSPTALSQFTNSSGIEALTWSANGSGANQYWVYAGTSQGSLNIFDSNNLGNVLTTSISGLPTNGSRVWIRLWYRSGSGDAWSFIDESYTAAGSAPSIDSSSGTGVLTAPNDTFNWNDPNDSVTSWWLYVGSAPGGNDYEDSGNLNSVTTYTTVSAHLPTGGVPVYVRLWFQQGSGTSWQFIDEMFTSGSSDSGGSAETPVIINEFVASNQASLIDNTGKYPDWIELYNTAAEPVDLSDWTLTAGSDTHVFSGTVIGANEYLIVFASGDPDRSTQNELHVDFKLSANGESLILTDNNGTVSDPVWVSDYPEQRPDISYGIDNNGAELFFNPPTPGAANTGGVMGFVESVTFSLDHGFYSDTQVVILSTATPSASVYYTLDGSTPTASNGFAVTSGSSIEVSQTTVIRALAIHDGWASSPVETRSYLFAAEIANRSEATPAGWPSDNSINDMRAHYGMDTDLGNGERVAVEVALTAIPSISLTTDLDNLFDPETGIWANPQSRGQEWERPVAVELIDPTGVEPGFEINGGIRIKGGSSRDVRNFKHSIRLVFRNEYGDGELEYPVHGPNGVDIFESLDVKTAQSWSWNHPAASLVGRGTDADWLRDIWNRDTQGAMGHLYTRSKYIHVYLNGHYWGLYYTEERSSNQYASQYLGGNESDYDVIKEEAVIGEESEVRAGTIEAWSSMWSMVEDLVLSDEEWVRFQNEINVINLADYYLLMWVAGDSDSTPRFNLKYSNNWFAIRDRTGEGIGGKWHFVDKDSESALCTNVQPERAPDWNPTPPWNLDGMLTPAWLMEAALTRPEFVLIFKDRVQLHMLTPGGALTVEESIARLDARIPSVDAAIDAEAARWGNTWVEPGFDRLNWESAIQIIRDCFELRTSVMHDYLAEDGLLP